MRDYSRRMKRLEEGNSFVKNGSFGVLDDDGVYKQPYPPELPPEADDTFNFVNPDGSISEAEHEKS